LLSHRDPDLEAGPVSTVPVSVTWRARAALVCRLGTPWCWVSAWCCAPLSHLKHCKRPQRVVSQRNQPLLTEVPVMPDVLKSHLLTEG